MEKTSKIGRRFEGKVAIITASTQGIGFGIAQRLGLEGASVVISSRRQRNVDEAVKKLKELEIEVLGLVCHVSNAQQRRNLIDQTIQKYRKIDVVVSNAAGIPSGNAILQTQESALDKIWDINAKASILLLQDASPHLTKGSSIVFISSISAFQPPPGFLAMYGVTKTTLLGLTKGIIVASIQALATELAPHTCVNCVAPGLVPTQFTEYITSNETMRKAFEEQTPLKRLGTIEDMAATTAFLASDETSYITGETIVVAGGLPSRL